MSARKEPTLTLDARPFLDALETVDHAAARKEARPILTTILLDVDDAMVRVIAADNMRACIVELGAPDGELRGRYPMIRADVVALRRSLAAAAKAHLPVTLALTVDLTLLVSWGRWRVPVGVMGGLYPDVDAITRLGPAVVALDPAYLGDIRHLVKRVPGPLVVHVTNPTSPVLFRSGNVVEVIMPVRHQVVTYGTVQEP